MTATAPELILMASALEPKSDALEIHMHYHVGHNTAGYLPESDPYAVSSLKEAEACSYADAARVHEEESEMFDADGDASVDQYPGLSGRDGDYWISYPESNRLQLHFWVSDACDCAEGEQELLAS